MLKHRLAGMFSVIAFAGLIVPSVSAEDRLSLISVWPQNFIYTSHFLKFVDSVNRQGKGFVQIDFRGGPEVTPRRQQADALRRGVIDMQFGSATHFVGLMPEARALLGASVTPSEAHRNGGIAKLNELAWNPKFNAHLLGWVQAGTQFAFYLLDPPKFNRDGVVDLSGLKIRTSPTYRDIVQALGGTVMVISASEQITAMERRLVHGTAFPELGVLDVGFQRYTKFKVTPAWLTAPITVQVNLDKWKGLTGKSREILTKVVREYEESSSRDFAMAIEKEREVLKRKWSVKDVPHSPDGAKNFLAIAYNSVWGQLNKISPDSARALRPLFNPGGMR